MRRPRVLVFASGSKDKGGSGFLHLILNMSAGVLPVDIVGVVCHHENGGVRKIADKHHIRFFPMASFTEEDYRRVALESGAEWFLLSGWLKKVCGLDPGRTINIHPGPTDCYGGNGMYGHHVHDAIIAAGEALSAVTMHFVDADYDRGPTFFVYPVSTSSCGNGDDLGALVNRYEHGWQSFVTWLVVSGQISWTGRKEDEVEVPYWYRMMPFCPERLRI